jgi:hypothetical protein
MVVKVEPEKLGYEQYREDVSLEMGLTAVYAYHCQRCNYTWLPRDFDIDNREKYNYTGHDLFYREHPRSCARCKSKSWKDVIPNRKLKVNPIFEGKKWINEDSINNDNYMHFAWINSTPRLKALNRQNKYTIKNIIQYRER